MKNNSEFYLIEKYDNNLNFKSANNIISLTPLSSYQLKEVSIKYKIMENYCDELYFMNYLNEFHYDQLAWFDKFDNLLNKLYPINKDLKLKLALSYYHYIKNMIDSIIHRCIVIEKFIKEEKPKRIFYISSDWESENICESVYPLYFMNCQSLFSRLVPIFCMKYGIDFERIIIDQKENIANNNGLLYSDKMINILKKIKNLQDLRFNLKTISIKKEIYYIKNKKLFFLKRFGYSLPEIIKESYKNGLNIYFLNEEGDIYEKKNYGFNRFIKKISKYNYKMINNNPNIEFDYEEILKWINKYCIVDVSSVIMPRLNYFINNYCHEFIHYYREFKEFYDDYSIDYLLAPHVVNSKECAALSASWNTKHTRSICLQHGEDVFDVKMRDYAEYYPFHIYLATDSEYEEYVKNKYNILNKNRKVEKYPFRLYKLNKIRKNRVKLNKNIIVYVPTMYQWDTKSWIETRIPDTWYYEWNIELYNYFKSQKYYKFIWKDIPESNKTFNPIIKLIKKENPSNIIYDKRQFIKWLKYADKIIIDYPSTALYEAAISKTPLISLYYEPLNIIREKTKEIFKNSLQPFNNYKDGILKIDKFINSNPDDYIVNIDIEKINMLQVINNIEK